MVYTELRRFFSQQNFAECVVNNDKAAFYLNRTDSGSMIVMVVIDNTVTPYWSEMSMVSFHKNLLRTLPEGMNPENIMYLVITDSNERDKWLAGIEGINLWLINSGTRLIYIFDRQPDDFWGLREELAAALQGRPASVNARIEKDNNGFFRASINNPGGVRTTLAFPYITVILIAANVIYYLIIRFCGNPSDALYMLRMGACLGMDVFEEGKIWELLTAMFVHFSFSHLVGNMISLGVIGNTAEKGMGHAKFFIVYMLAGFGGNVISAAYHFLTGQWVVTGGASGAVYGILAAAMIVTVFVARSGRKQLRKAYYSRIVFALLYLIFSNFVNSDGVDIMAHIGGFAFGILLTLMLMSGGKTKEKNKHMRNSM